MRSKSKSTRDKPWVSNYPPLQEWLDKVEAKCQWQIPMQPKPTADDDYEPDWAPTAYVECWAVGKGTVIIIVRAEQHGWEIYSALDSNSVQESLADVEKRCGVGT